MLTLSWSKWLNCTKFTFWFGIWYFQRPTPLRDRHQFIVFKVFHKWRLPGITWLDYQGTLLRKYSNNRQSKEINGSWSEDALSTCFSTALGCQKIVITNLVKKCDKILIRIHYSLPLLLFWKITCLRLASPKLPVIALAGFYCSSVASEIIYVGWIKLIYVQLSNVIYDKNGLKTD